MAVNKKNKTPSVANWLAKKFINDRLLEEFYGDLQEIFEERRSKQGLFIAQLMYWVDVFHLVFGFTTFHVFKNQNSSTLMYGHYFLVARRNLWRNKAHSLINILGLAMGMGVCLIIYQYVDFELSYDRFHFDVENTYRIIQNHSRNGEHFRSDNYLTYGFGRSSKEEIPEIKNLVRIRPVQYDEGIVIANAPEGKAFTEFDNVWYVDSTFLQMFNFPLLYGERVSALNDMHSIVITEHAAKKYFGNTNPIGQGLKVSGGNLSGNFTVTGILKQPLGNSHLQFDFLMPMHFLLGNYGLYVRSDGWVWQNFLTYVTLVESANLEAVGQKFDHIIDTHIGGELAQLNIKTKIGFEPIADIHLKSELDKKMGNLQNVWFFSIISIFIMVIAWVNYINLSTARAIHRSKEVGIRKSIGAHNKQLIVQFLFESFLINCIAAIISVGTAFIFLLLLNHFIGKELELEILQNFEFWIGFVVVVFFGSLLSGVYPSFVLSSFKPMSVFKAERLIPNMSFGLRKGLIVFQFLTSLFLISGTYLVYKQITFMKTQDLGVNMEQILIVPGPRTILKERETLESKYQVFKSNILKHHSIEAITGTSNIPGKGTIWRGGMRRLGVAGGEEKLGDAILVDSNFTKTYDFEFLAGEPFDQKMQSFSAAIINEEAVKTFGLKSPIEAIDESIILVGVDTLRIHGVVKNVNWSSLRDAYQPTVYALEHQYNAHFSIKMNLSDIPKTLAHVESTYHEAFPDDPFDYFFLSDDFNRQYRADIEFGNLFSAFTALAIFIACIGLFALVSFSATLRIKELGIRKVLGASIRSLMLLLSKEYLFLLLIANLLVIPPIFFGARSWLDNYAFRIDIGMDLFIIPALVLLLISFLTVSHRTYASAKANPVDSLRTE